MLTTVEAGCHRRVDHVLSDNMIRNFSDHSATERTFLAWVRTAIAVMAFGFLAEKFDLFLEVAEILSNVVYGELAHRCDY